MEREPESESWAEWTLTINSKNVLCLPSKGGAARKIERGGRVGETNKKQGVKGHSDVTAKKGSDRKDRRSRKSKRGR